MTRRYWPATTTGWCGWSPYLGGLAHEHVIQPGLGDHMEPQPDGSTSSAPRHTPTALTSTAIYYWDVRTLARIAAILGRGEDAQRYRELAERIGAAFNHRFLDPRRGTYATGSQTANATALQMGLVPAGLVERVLENLVHDITVRHDGHLSTGMVGTNALVNALPRHGAAEVMYRIATRTTFPSWGFMLERDATTLWETWSDDRDEQLSLNMKLLGSIGKFFYRDVAGIRPLAPGFHRIAVAPKVVGPIRHASASIETVRGAAAVSWRVDGDGALRLAAEIPANATAEVRLPTGGRTAVQGHRRHATGVARRRLRAGRSGRDRSAGGRRLRGRGGRIRLLRSGAHRQIMKSAAPRPGLRESRRLVTKALRRYATIHGRFKASHRVLRPSFVPRAPHQGSRDRPHDFRSGQRGRSHAIGRGRRGPRDLR